MTLERAEGDGGGVGDGYVKVFLKVDRPLPGLAEQVREISQTPSTSSSQRSDAAEARSGRPRWTG